MAEPTKVCPKCEVRKPWSAYYVRTRWEDGSVRTVLAYCKVCHNKRALAWKHRNPAKVREQDRRMRLKRRSEPERLATWQAYIREWKRKNKGHSAMTRPPIEGGYSLPTEPFARWLREVVERDESTIRATALRLEIGEKTVRNILTTQRHVGIETVERALIADDTITLRELYPSLYEEAA